MTHPPEELGTSQFGILWVLTGPPEVKPEFPELKFSNEPDELPVLLKELSKKLPLDPDDA